ncbi:MAG TPA: hypothetical protein VK619_06420 [Pyrinomonadaceae bacterium]|nr:hypothetical protein [Pyrinomonadaceae bacterium]
MNTFRTRTARIILLLVVTTLMTASVPAQRGTSIVRRVRFARGRTSTVLRGTLRRGVSHDYLLGASAGQTMSVHLASPGGLSFSIIGPYGRALADFTRDWSGELPANGDYRINVLPDTSTNQAFPYTLEITIRY